MLKTHLGKLKLARQKISNEMRESETSMKNLAIKTSKAS